MFKTREITILGLFISLGIILPYATGHMFGIPGTILLPMHIPVILIGLFYGQVTGFMLGMLIPFLSSILTGMPSVVMLPIMMVELSLYGFMCGLMYKKLNMHIYISLITAMITGRSGYLIILYIFADILNMEAYTKVASVYVAIIVGMPGIILQLVGIPIIVKFLGGYICGKTTI
ncbi:MAG: hypothetical protein BEN19_04390 [Epulopiscium sp. Nuni2H_MBin003]|nr:MAG: hypothetical protein BEN19_04390 [Epulopiscium sp. Nuni2H_MBin003]